ncbi:ABC transporter ATP-binding protein [Yoonia sp.]|uniref:ABC transporter ATP-binding protein n=1 Tax=Yoonia sp. TaxID=2212373 RepID=UPI0040482CEC
MDFIRRLDITERLLARLGANLRDQHLRAVDTVDLIVAPGEVVGLVGESGCGKSTLARVATGIHKPSAGKLMFRGRDVATLDRAGRRDFTLKAQIVFQDPFSALNPRQRVGQIISEAPLVHGLWPHNEAGDRLDAVMAEVGLDLSIKTRYPHQFSGGQRQRIGIARALAVSPDLLVCDEAVAALDVSVQAQILNLFADLREKRGLTYLFISHDLSVIRHLADKVVVMYLGRVMESAPRADLFATPNHPYTRALLEQVPRLDQRRQTYKTISGEIPSPLNPPPGCLFHTRCLHAGPRCRNEAPVLREVAPGHLSACHLNDG